MLKVDLPQTSYVSGELDPQLTARTDVTAYYTGVERARNVLLIPQGGFTRRPGLKFCAEAPPVIEKLDLTGKTLTAPNGGTAANAVDDNEATTVLTTTNIGTLDPYIIFHLDLGTAEPVWFADVRNFSVSGTGFLNLTDELRIQYSDDNAAWSDFGEPFDNFTREDNRWNYRRGNELGRVTHRYWRVVRIGATNGGTSKFELGEFRLWKAVEPEFVSATRIVDFEFKALETYSLLATDQNLRVFLDGVYQDDIAIPHTAAQIQQMTWAQESDTLLLFHEDVQTHRIERQGTSREWIDRPLTFTSIPTRDFKDLVSAGGGAEPVWSATRGWPRTGSFFKGRLYVGGTRDLSSTYWASGAKGDVYAFVRPASEPQADDAFELTIGETAASIYYMLPSDFLFIMTAAGPFVQEPREDPPTGDNATPQRLRGNKRARGPGFRAFGLDKAIVFLDDSGEQVNEIVEEVFRGSFEVNNLAFFAPHLIRDPQEMTFRRALSANRGDLILLVNSDGSMAVLQTLRDREFTGWTSWHAGKGAADALQGRFVAVGVQVGGIDGRYYAVVERTIDGRVRRFFEEFREDYLLDASVLIEAINESFVLSSDGQATVVYSFESPGDAADICVRRNKILLDQGVDYSVDLGTKTITFLTPADNNENDIVRVAIRINEVDAPHLEGETLRVRVDGAVGADVTVTGGKASIAEFSDEQVEVGLAWPDVKEIEVNELVTRQFLTEEEARFSVFSISDGRGAGDGLLVRDMPADIPPDPSGPSLRGKKKRVHTAVISVTNTQGLYFGANDEPPEPVDFAEFGDFLLDRRPPLRTTEIRIDNLQGWTLSGQTEITQRDPLPLTVVAMVREIVVATR
ncbi:hypothetical protein HBA54_03165 [Pelagibius litoralis]|uniref:F5/8 type C domain-containing protein n=1 Tax=Pelagibius litoralis TaxID=374515 RepID=A0A967C748_9PROT|nr:hypothetical protein [Pelagibius litoralis]NIA67582.1 hypothetical protein [Pelagibius litoralis]